MNKFLTSIMKNMNAAVNLGNSLIKTQVAAASNENKAKRR